MVLSGQSGSSSAAKLMLLPWAAITSLEEIASLKSLSVRRMSKIIFWSPRQSLVKETTRNLASPIGENQEIRMLGTHVYACIGVQRYTLVAQTDI